MGTTLTGTTPQDTYDSLIKVTDNAPLGTTGKYLSDGLGNDSALALSTTLVGIGRVPSAGFVLDIETGLGTYPRITGSDQANVRLRFANGGAGGRNYELIGGLAGANNSNFSIFDATAAATRLTIDSTGNVGIGTSAPTGKLTVSQANSGGVAAILLTQDESTIQGPSANTYLKMGGNMTIGAAGVIPIQIATTEVLRVTANGLTFNGDSAAANALDDYEEGTFTATIAPATSGTITLNATFTTWTYTKIGRQVTINGVFVISSVASPVGANVVVGGLPFTILNNNGAYGAFSVAYFTSATSVNSAVAGRHSINTTQLTLGVNASTVAASDEIYVTATYFV